MLVLLAAYRVIGPAAIIDEVPFVESGPSLTAAGGSRWRWCRKLRIENLRDLIAHVFEMRSGGAVAGHRKRAASRHIHGAQF